MRTSFIVCLLLMSALLLADNIKSAAAAHDDVKRTHLIFHIGRKMFGVMVWHWTSDLERAGSISVSQS